MSERFDIVVIGAGIVGLAVARALALRGRQVLVLERHRAPAQETSSRNSGVIHSGIYYPTGSLKAVLCVQGRQMLYDYCARRQVAHSRCGKLIVAQASQRPALDALQARALSNGVGSLQSLSGAQVRSLEPEIECAAGLLCPDTGIVDVHELAYAYLGDLEANGGLLASGAAVQGVRRSGSGFTLRVRSGDESSELACGAVVNAAGLEAVDLLRCIDGYPAQRLRKAWFAKGCYFTLGGLRPFTHLVYPMPGEAGLGIHATLDLDGSTRFGPNVVWVDAPEYSVEMSLASEFYAAIRSYWPALPEGSLQAGYAGVRPKLVGPGTAAADFEIEGPAAHGCEGLVNLLGIESPGITASLAIGERVAGMI
jgi:L-2-hydroxyglutarate oxidase LhgO